MTGSLIDRILGFQLQDIKHLTLFITISGKPWALGVQRYALGVKPQA